MVRYAGTSNDDETRGGHGYLEGHRHGGEAFNFRPLSDGTMRGYRPPGGNERTNITRMGAAQKSSQIEGALVVWIAKEPDSGRALIVGWYRNAIVYRVARSSEIELYGEQLDYSAEAAVSDAVLLPPHLRTFRVESSRTKPGAGFGQKPTWYGAEDVNKRVWEYIRAHKSSHEKQSRPEVSKGPRNPDPVLRRRVEKAAVAHATKYFNDIYGPSAVISVEQDARGWDLEVYAGLDPLLVEVKGLTNSELICELTPNEYEKMMLPKHRKNYIIYVVNNALAEPPGVPIASIFKHAGGESWMTDDGRKLVVTPKIAIAAVLTCS